MKHQKWMLGPAAVAFVLGTTGVTMAAPAAGGDTTPAAGKQGRGKRAGRAGQRANQGARGVTILNPQLLEKVLGKPLTEEQRKGVQDAATAYQESVAKAVGLTADELRTKVRAYRATQRGTGKAGGAANKAPAGGAAAPAG